VQEHVPARERSDGRGMSVGVLQTPATSRASSRSAQVQIVQCLRRVTGACCIETECSILTEADCIAGGGTYKGDGTVCDPNPCCSCCVVNRIQFDGTVQATFNCSERGTDCPCDGGDLLSTP